MTERICENCGLKFNVKPSRIASGRGGFCSKVCNIAYNRKDVTIKLCDHCGNIITNRGNIKFCSHACKVKFNNVDKICTQCGAQYSIKKSTNLTSIFCSLECHNLWMASNNNKGINNYQYKRIEKICIFCRETFYVVESSYSRRKCCSKECDSKLRSILYKGDNAPAWCGGNIIKICEECGIEYDIPKSRANRSKFCSRTCQNINYGENHTQENHHNWQGGITLLNNAIRSSSKMNKWRSDVFKRDNYTDVITGLKSHNLNAHHLISFQDLISKYEITTLQEALDCEELWDISNGITLDRDNHMKIYHPHSNFNHQTLIEIK
jgi:hypothetical protein